MPEATATAVQVKFGDDTTVSLTPEAIKALRAQAIRELEGVRLEIGAHFEDMRALDGPDARYDLELLGDALRRAEKTVDVLWWLAPEAGDDEPVAA